MIYATARLYVREMTIDDIPALRKTLQNEQTMYAYAHAFTDAEVNTWLANNLRRYQEDGFGLWAIIRKADQEFIGQCGLTVQNFADQQVVEIGYLLQREYWGQGYAIEAARGAKSYAFNQLHVPEVWSIIRDNNIASMNVAIRNGMLVRGKIMKHYYGIDMPHFGFMARNPQV